MSEIQETAAIIERALAGAQLEYARPKPEIVLVGLPGERRLNTTVQFSLGRHGVRIEAFVCRKPEENQVGVYRYLLERNQRLYGVAYTLDRVGDIYLVGRLSRTSVTEAEIDRICGQIVQAVDGDFNTLLELGFAAAIRREWDWRVSRGESVRNLAAFKHLVTSDDTTA